MRKLVAIAPGRAQLVDYQQAALKPHEVRVTVDFASPKHGTEIVDFRGDSPFVDEYFADDWRLFMPRESQTISGEAFAEFPLGNMVVGHLTEVGTDVTQYREGERVCTYGPIMEAVVVNGVDNHRLRRLSEDGAWQNAVCYDPAQFALGAIRDARVRVGDFVVVFGLGAIGQIAIQLAKKAGAYWVAGVDPLRNRRELAIRLGAHECFDPASCDVGYEVKRQTGKLGADAIIETSGSIAAMQAALRGVAYGGTIAYVAFAKSFPAGLNLGREAHFNQAKVIFSRAASEPNLDHPRWNRKRIEDTCWELLINSYLNCEEIIDPVVPFEESAQSYMHYVDQHPELSIKMGVTFKTKP